MRVWVEVMVTQSGYILLDEPKGVAESELAEWVEKELDKVRKDIGEYRSKVIIRQRKGITMSSFRRVDF